MVLVVEDEVIIRVYVADYLRDSGFDVVEAADASQALKILESAMPVDLVFTDITLPGELDGLGLAQMIRRRQPTLPIILTSGKVSTEAARELCKQELFFAKPCDYSIVAARIRALLENKIS